MQQVDRTLNSQKQSFTIYHAYKKIGTCAFYIEDHLVVDRKQTPILPDSWFLSKKSEYVLPFLKVTGLETMGKRKQGNGRLCLQALFECAKRSGCEGRMVVESAFGSASFYEHCGFEGKEVGQDGLKYFEPNQKSLSLLYKGNEQEGTLKLIPLPIQHSKADKELFDRMVMNAQNMRQRV